MTGREPWYEDDAFWGEMAPFLFDERRLLNAPMEVDAIIALLDVPEGARVLDLCCGVGRHAIELARRGFRVTGVDRTEIYLERARGTADAEGLDVELVREDMRTFRRPGAFDVVLNLFTSFGYFDDPADDLRVLRHVHESLAPGGRFVAEMMGKEVLAERFQERDWNWIGEGEGVFLEERRITDDWGRCANRWILIRGDRRSEYRFVHRLYSAVELAALFREAGFSAVDAYGSLAGEPYDHLARRLVVVGRR
jgi:SAM-dependent methyltransferase